MRERLSDRIRVAARVQPHQERHRQIDELADKVRALEAEMERLRSERDERYPTDEIEGLEAMLETEREGRVAVETERDRLRAALNAVVYLEGGTLYIKGEAPGERRAGRFVAKWITGRINRQRVMEALASGAGADSTTSGTSRAPGLPEGSSPAPQHTCDYEASLVETLLEWLNDEHNDGNPTEPTPRMYRAARVFVHRVMREWKPGAAFDAEADR